MIEHMITLACLFLWSHLYVFAAVAVGCYWLTYRMGRNDLPAADRAVPDSPCTCHPHDIEDGVGHDPDCLMYAPRRF
jgi:hypothetical protein